MGRNYWPETSSVSRARSSVPLLRWRTGPRQMMTSSATTYHQYGTWTDMDVIGHQNDMGAVAMSRRKCAATPQAAPARMSSAVADRGRSDRSAR
jgi:hypothetical protein